MKKIIILFAAFSIIACNNNPSDSESKVIEGKVFFKNIADGDTLGSTFFMEMGVEGMQVEPKGEPREGFGHHHLLINDDFTPAGTIIVADSTHIHYGGGQVEDSVMLDPGDYKLTLQFANGEHVSFGESWSSSVNVVVK